MGVTINMVKFLFALAALFAIAHALPSADKIVPESADTTPAYPDLAQLSAKTGDDYCNLCHNFCPSCQSVEDGCPDDWAGDCYKTCDDLEGSFPASDDYGPVAGMTYTDACKNYCLKDQHCPTTCSSTSEAKASAPAAKEVVWPDLVQLSSSTGNDYCELCHDVCPGCMHADSCPESWDGDCDATCDATYANNEVFEDIIDESMSPVTGGSKASACKMYCTQGNHCPSTCTGGAEDPGRR